MTNVGPESTYGLFTDATFQMWLHEELDSGGLSLGARRLHLEVVTELNLNLMPYPRKSMSASLTLNSTGFLLNSLAVPSVSLRVPSREQLRHLIYSVPMLDNMWATCQNLGISVSLNSPS